MLALAICVEPELCLLFQIFKFAIISTPPNTKEMIQGLVDSHHYDQWLVFNFIFNLFCCLCHQLYATRICRLQSATRLFPNVRDEEIN